MKGTRPLDNDEIRLVSACFTGTYEVRNRSLFLLGVSTGGRISELLSLRIGDVWQNRRAVTDLLYDKSIVKGGEVSRAVPVNTDSMRAIDNLIRWHRERYGYPHKSRPLFPSRNGHLATHSLRKSFVQRLYEQTGDVFTVQEMLGHKSIATTQKYLGVNYASVREALQKMSLDGELHERNLLGSSLKKEADETLFLELALRGYDLSSLRDNETTAEIIKIG